MTAAALAKPRTGRSANLIEGDFAFTAEDFARIKTLLREDSGIHLPDAKATLVYSRLGKRLRSLGIASFADYCDLVASDAGLEERRAMMAALTTNVTRFFREPHHFEHLKLQALPAWIAAARRGERVRIWSAGCSSGQEPYSIALTLLSVLPEAGDLDIRLLATDIDPIILGQARQGAYPDEAIEAIPQDMRRNFLKREDGGWSMGEAVRRLIVFNELNLMGPFPMKGRFQAIFCRNVAIYFDMPTQERLWGRFADALTPDGRLYIGHSERATDPRFESDGLTTYRLRSPV
jgi:chemotaxis protein methyltransferase CheR